MAKWYDWFVSFTAAVGGFLFGYEIGIINSVLSMDAFEQFFQITDANADSSVRRTANIVSFFLFGCIPGALIVAFSADAFGRKRSILIGSFLFTLGAILQATVPTSYGDDIDAKVRWICSGRFIGGLGVGIMSSAVPLFIAEIAPTNIRGRLTSVQQLMITIGIAFAAICNAIIIGVYKNDSGNNSSWRSALAIQAGPGALLFIMLFFVPESPRWLITRGRDEEALAKLSKLRQMSEKSPEVQEEYHEYKLSFEAEKQVGTASWSELLRPGIVNRLAIGVILQLFQQWTGINAIMYYSSLLFQGMGLSKVTATTVAVVVQDLINVLFTLPGMYLIERSGRKKLMFIGGLGLAFASWMMVLFVTLLNNIDGVKGVKAEDINYSVLPGKARAYSVISVLMVFVFVAFFAATWGPVVWVYQSEIFPLRIRGKGAGIATLSNWVNNAIISYVWPFANKSLGSFQYCVFGCTGLMMAAYVAFFVPETMGKSLEEMDDVFGFVAGSNARHDAERHDAELKA
ncbi:hypothetical protein RI367_004573 [Sorochytrium milnesiophthora]